MKILAGVVLIIILTLVLYSMLPEPSGDTELTLSGNRNIPPTISSQQGISPQLTTAGFPGSTGNRVSGNPAEFQADTSSGPAPLTVAFTSGGYYSEWTWYFGDGSRSTDRDPVHTYDEPGVYTVTHNVVVNGQQYEDSVVITVQSGLKAYFTESPPSGYAPLAVKFSDESTGSPSSWSWTFGDGTTSYLQNPVHTYTAPGSYRVVLTIRKGDQSDSKVSTVTVYESAAPLYTPQTTAAPTKAPTVAAATTTYVPYATHPRACSSYSYTINGRTVSGTCCGSLTTSMTCNNGACTPEYQCNGVRIT